MSPVNSDDSPGDAVGASGRPLTRKEIRAREKSLATQGHEAIPPQAYETGQDAPTRGAPRSRCPPPAAAPSAPLAAADTPSSACRGAHGA